MLDLQIPETSRAVGYIRRKIEQQYQSLRNLLHFNNGLFLQEKERIKRDQEIEMAKLHEQHEGEVPEFLVAKETEIADRYQWEEEALFYTENGFYHAALIMAFSYYESLVAAICHAAEENKLGKYVGDNLKTLMTSYKIKFSDEKQFEYVNGNLKKARNYLTHNYNLSQGENNSEAQLKKQLIALKEESDKNIGLTLVANEKLDKSAIIVVLNSKYVEQALDKMYDILVELADLLGFK